MNTTKWKKTEYENPEEVNYSGVKETPVNTQKATPTQQNTAQPQQSTYKPVSVVPTASSADNAMKNLAAAKNFSYNGSKPTYASPYSAQIDMIFNEIMSTPDFEYNPEKDTSYQALKGQYTNLGQRAMKDTTAQIAAQTGGIASSYASSAGAQAYQQYMGELAGFIPELQQLAYEMYQNDLNEKYKQLGMYQDMEADAYGKYRDELNEYYTDYDIAYNQFLNEQKQDNYLNELLYQREQDALNRQDYLDDKAYGRAQDEWEKQRYENEFEYQKSLDSLKQQNYENEFDYQKYLNELEQQNYENNYNFNREQFEYEKEQNELDRIWDEALTKAELGDYSGVNKLGIDMSNYGTVAEEDEDFDPYSKESIGALVAELVNAPPTTLPSLGYVPPILKNSADPLSAIATVTNTPIGDLKAGGVPRSEEEALKKLDEWLRTNEIDSYQYGLILDQLDLIYKQRPLF